MAIWGSGCYSPCSIHCIGPKRSQFSGHEQFLILFQIIYQKNGSQTVLRSHLFFRTPLKTRMAIFELYDPSGFALRNLFEQKLKDFEMRALTLQDFQEPSAERRIHPFCFFFLGGGLFWDIPIQGADEGIPFVQYPFFPFGLGFPLNTNPKNARGRLHCGSAGQNAGANEGAQARVVAGFPAHRGVLGAQCNCNPAPTYLLMLVRRVGLFF